MTIPNHGLSVVVIAHREEDRIGRCLMSVREIASELVVVIQQADDPTAQIAKDAGARVVLRKWTGYVDQKNEALRQARHQWVLQLDADEAVSVELAESISAFVREDNLDYDAASFAGRERYYGKWLRFGLAQRWWDGRLVRNGTARWDGGLVHEHLERGRACRLQGLLEHYSCRSSSHLDKKNSSYADLWVAQRIMEGRPVPTSAEIFVRPLFRFVVAFVVRLGFLDGVAGYLHAAHRRHYTLQKYARLREYFIAPHYKSEIDRLIQNARQKGVSRRHGLDRIRGHKKLV